ncbi:rotatin isoform X3 [Photinus pyralis]|nr:rotatin isoform X3 [Photinus pyralis]XP_031350384.1 rotatin isoform X3 [Photinus pyralis]
MLQDFPAEVFLQRPSIVLLFLDYMRTSVSSRLTNAILNCFIKLTKCLKTRIFYYSDPSMHNKKEKITIEIFSGTSSPLNAPPHVHHTFEGEDETLLKSKQLLLPQYCFTIMLAIFQFLCVKPESLRREYTSKKSNLIGTNLALALLDELIFLLNLCLKSNAWDKKSAPGVIEVLHTFEKVLEKFAEALEHFRLEVTSDETNTTNRTTHLRLLSSCCNLIIRLIPLNVADFILPKQMKNALSNCLLDVSLARLYPNIHENILQFVKEFGGRFETDSVAKYKEVNQVCQSISSVVKLLRTSDSLPVLNAMELANDAVLSLGFHKNSSFINLVINLCANKLPATKKEECFQVAESVLLKLLAHNHMELRQETYRQCESRIIATIGPKFNATGAGAPGSQILFLLRAPILLEISLYGLTSENKEIQKYADNILVHILKCQILVTESIWNKVIDAILPVLPILICHATKMTVLGRSIVGILDPDTAKTFLIPPLEVLKSNLCLLFVGDSLAREEAVSRLCWLLTTQTNSRNLLPRMNSLRDKALSKACHVQRVADINRERPAQHFYQANALHHVLELLNAKDVEPTIRRSALTQISVMLEDPHLHYAFLDNNGIGIVLNAIENALMEVAYKDYVDCIIPSIAILKYICLHSSSTRQELCSNFDLYCNILRGLFIFCSEERVRQDCSTLLCLLLFSGYVLGSPASMDLSLPFLVVDQLSLPFSCNSHWRASKHALPDLQASLLSDKWCRNSIQIHWNSEWFGGFAEILRWKEIQHSEFSSDLRLNNNSLLILKSSCLEYCIFQCLMDIQNAISHSSIVDSISKLDSYIHLFTLTKQDDLEKAALLKFAWESNFTRFLNTPPATEEDNLVLMAVLKLLSKLVPFYSLQDDTCWIVTIFKTPSHVLPNLLQIESSPDFEIKPLHQELLYLITVCVWHDQHYLDLHCVRPPEAQTSAWLHIIKTISENLKFTESQHFYNLSYLDCMLSCLVHLTTALGWSSNKKSLIPRDPIPRLITGLCELVSAFHCGKGSSAADSLMGLSITRHITLILNNLLLEMQYVDAKGWEIYFLSDQDIEESIFYSICALWLSRDVVLRAAILQLLAGLAMSPRAAIELVQQIKDCKTGYGVWETMLAILLDNDEASIVRENAANVLFNLTSHTESSTTNLTIINSLVPCKHPKADTAITLILEKLQQFKFFTELPKILEILYLKPDFTRSDEARMTEISPHNLHVNDEVNLAYTRNLIQHTSLPNSPKNVDVVITPVLVKNICMFVCNLLLLSENKVIHLLQDSGLIKLFFRCLSKPHTDVKSTRDLALYCDILEMNASICSVLTRAVNGNAACRNTVIHTRDCFNILLSLLNPNLYYESLAQLVYLRNKLWTEIFVLVGALLEDTMVFEALGVVTNSLNECGHQAFLLTLCESISANSSFDLQTSALMSLTSLLRAEAETKSCETERGSVALNSPSMTAILDTVKTPRSSFEQIEIDKSDKPIEVLWEQKRDNATPGQDKLNVFENSYFSQVRNKLLELSHKRSQCETESETAQDDALMAGATLCKILLHLYDASTIRNRDRKKTVITNTLTSILAVSSEAKKLALHNGLMETIVKQLKELQVKLSLESVACLRRLTDKKRVCPILREFGNVIGLTTNFMLGDESVKCAAAVLGFSDVIHKLWVWLCADRTLLSDGVKMLCTYSTNCYLACQSMTLTSAVAGTGPRKVPSAVSLLHELVNLVDREMDLVSRTHELGIFELVFHLLQNACSVLECRHILIKANILQCVSRLHPAITKRQKTWENVEVIWLEFLFALTGYAEGQLGVAKATEALDIVMMLTTSTKSVSRNMALLVLRNISFHQSNRPRLLNSADFIKILQMKLTSGTMQEKNVVVSIIWALIANNQRGKLILKCAGLDVRLHEVIKHISVSPEEAIDVECFSKMQRVLSILKEGEKVR